MSLYFHEELYRSAAALASMKEFRITVCGAGALGSNISESLARSGYGRLKVIDMDRVEERNLSTQPYQRADIGAYKVKMLANMLYRAVGVKIEMVGKELTADNAGKMLAGSQLVIDTFDNSIGRGAVKDWCAENDVPCLHVGLAGDYAEVIWNEIYRVPSPANDDVCDYPLARNLVSLATGIGCEVVTTFVLDGRRESFTLTLRDFAVRAFEGLLV